MLTQYEKYQLEWLIDHGYSLKYLVNRLGDIINAELNVNTNAHVILDEAFEILEYEQGFKESEIWACEDEWEKLDNDKDEQ